MIGRCCTVGLTLLLALAERGVCRSLTFTPEQVRGALRARLSPAELAALTIPYEADSAIREKARELTTRAHSDQAKLQAILAYFRERDFVERHRNLGTRTAREVFEDGQGNCLAYANLMVAMARAAGLRALYLDASGIGREQDLAGRTLVDYGHILVGVQVADRLEVVDFDGQIHPHNRYRVLSDLQAIADFYNNRGFELAWEDRAAGGLASPRALEALTLSTRIWPAFARAWNNLGVARLRRGETAEAQEAFARASRADPLLAAPHANLGTLHLRQGAVSAALQELEIAAGLDPQNAHYRYFQGRALVLLGRDEEALAAFERALEQNDRLFLALLEIARIRERRGELDRAADSARRVLALIPNQRDARQLLDRISPAAKS
jgi:tetratricopeptide (TPR) repeat protein